MTTSENRPAKFSGASRYVLDEELAKIVNISMALEMPLLLKGEPGTGKTMLAHAIAESLRMPLITLNVKSSMKLIDALYQYDTLTRLNDSRFADSGRNVSNIEEYIKMSKIGQAFTADKKVVLLIDEIDKADTDFQDDMLDILDQMQFDIIEIDRTVRAKKPSGDRDYLQRQERSVRSVPGALQLPSHRLSRPRYDAPDHRCAFSGCQPGPHRRLPGSLLPPARSAWRRKEAGHPRVDQLDARAAGRSRFSDQKSEVGQYPLPGRAV